MALRPHRTVAGHLVNCPCRHVEAEQSSCRCFGQRPLRVTAMFPWRVPNGFTIRVEDDGDALTPIEVTRLERRVITFEYGLRPTLPNPNPQSPARTPSE